MLRLVEIVERDQQKALAQREHLVDQHVTNVLSISRRADYAEKQLLL